MKRFFEELKAEMTVRKDQLAKKMRYFKYVPILLFLAVMGGVTALPTYADTIASSKIGTGLTKLIQDATSFLMVVAPVAMVVMLIYFFSVTALAFFVLVSMAASILLSEIIWYRSIKQSEFLKVSGITCISANGGAISNM